MPTDDDCPVRVNQLDNYRKTVIHRDGVTHVVLVDALWELSERDQHALASDVSWTCETWFQVKCESVALPGEASNGLGAGVSRDPPVNQEKGMKAKWWKSTFFQACGQRLNGAQTPRRFATCSPTCPRTHTARTVNVQRWRTSKFDAKGELQRMRPRSLATS